MKINLLNILSKNVFILIFVLAIGITFNGCVKGDFDEPPTTGIDPTDITADQIISLEEVLAKWVTGQFVALESEKYVQGVIVGDDKSGNLYKTLVIQDENSDKAITILVDDTNLFNQYPVGRRVFVDLKDLWISDYNGLPQLGYGPYLSGSSYRMSGIPAALTNDILRKGVYGITIEPLVVKMNQLGEAALNRLIKIENAEFKTSSAGKPYADADLQASVNHTLTACDGGEIVVRTSGFALFARELTPAGNGDFIGIYTIFGTTKQLIVRDPSDLNMADTRCNGGTIGGGSDITIASLRSAYTSGSGTAPSGKITGVVVSDKSSNNFQARNLHLQDASGGIVLRFSSNHIYSLGDEISVDVSGVELSEFNGLLQLNNLPNANATRLGSKDLPLTEITVKEAVDNIEKYESTRVKIKGVTISGGSTYAGTRKVADATSSIDLFTLNAATFSGQSVPTGTVDIIAIVSQFTSAQLLLNSAADVTGGNTGSGGDDTKISIESLRGTYTGTATVAPAGFIEGVVISDYTAANITSKNITIQDGEYGIIVRFAADPNIPMGKKVKIKVSGLELSVFNELLQLNNVPNANILANTDGTLPTPKVITISDLTSNFEKHESTLVTINGATLSGASTYSGTLKITDSTGNMDFFTRSQATFAGDTPPSAAVNITAIVTQFKSATTTGNGYQVSIRNLNDIK